MNSSPRPRREIVCEVCRQRCFTQLKSRDICRPCHRREASACCARCGLRKHHVSDETGLCPLCTQMVARPIAPCARCTRTVPIYDEAARLCRLCEKAVRFLARAQEKKIKVQCSVCGQLRSSALLGRAICRTCWRVEQHGRSICAVCKRLKVIFVQGEQLCQHCYADRMAPRVLQRYLARFTTPYPSNKVLFDLLASTISWEHVGEKIAHKFRVFGLFLQQQYLPEPITWETLEQALPVLQATNRTTPKHIRSCLLDVGHLLAARGQLESWETYVARRNALLPLERAPQQVQELLRRYAGWLWERQTVPANVRDHLEALASFWEWCAQHDIRGPAVVQTPLLNDYLLTLYWQWHCLACGHMMAFEPRQRKAPRACSHCGTLHASIQVRRYAQNTVRGHRAKLFVFFSWAKINHLVVANPLSRRTPAPSPTIRHYPLETIKQLCAYLVAPDAEPTAALSLYLILFHGFSVWELQHVQLPALLPLQREVPVPSLAEAYYLMVPRPAPSLGDRSPGRPSIRLDFPARAASWLKPLLERYEQQRQQVLRNPNNRYLLVAPGKAKHNTPVSKVFVWKTIRCASFRVLGAACNPSTLRKTAGVLFTDHAGPGILRWMGWDDQQAFAYVWAAREIVYPQELLTAGPLEPPNTAPRLFPAAQGGNVVCDD